MFKNFEELDAALQHEAFSAGARVEKVANSRQGIAGFNAAYARETAGLEGLQTQAVRVGDTPVAGRRLKGGKWTPLKLSADELAEKQARLEWMGQQKAEYDALVARRPQLDEEIAAAGKKGDEAAVHQLGREKDIYELEVQHMERVLNEWEPLLLKEDVAHQRVKTVEEGLVDTLASMERRTRLVRGDDASVGGYSPEGAEGRTFQDVVMGMIERGGSGVDEGTGETLFALKAKDREAAQELLKDAFGSSEWGPWRLLSGDEALDREIGRAHV